MTAASTADRSLDTNTSYDQLIAHLKESALLGSTASLLSWDQETMMPPDGLAYRVDQLTLLAKLGHERATDPRIGRWLAACEADAELVGEPQRDAAVNVREARRDYEKATKLPGELVEELARVASNARAAWAAARKKSEYALFEPHLRKVVELSRRKAECLGWAEDGEPWDALADNFEAGLSAAYVSSVFTPLRPRLVKLIEALAASPTPPSDAFAKTVLPQDKQMAFVRDVVAAIGFDFNAGRLDTTVHPFCSGTHCRDVRLTTRFHDDMLHDALGSTMHEAGHGIYNQGLPIAHVGTPRGEPAGLSIHESQSRLWENHVGRSRAFWRWCYPKLREHFGDAVAHLSEDDVYAGTNAVMPSLIRVEADEATYNLHIMVRFELERELVNGTLDTADLPEAWNGKYKEYLGVEVPDDARGCLQDIHWSMGALGYFPTYTLGNLYAAQFYEAAGEALGDLDAQLAAGDFAPLRQWLNHHIHAHGKTYRAEALCQRVTGKPLSPEPLLRHLEGKLRPLYGV